MNRAPAKHPKSRACLMYSVKESSAKSVEIPAGKPNCTVDNTPNLVIYLVGRFSIHFAMILLYDGRICHGVDDHFVIVSFYITMDNHSPETVSRRTLFRVSLPFTGRSVS